MGLADLCLVCLGTWFCHASLKSLVQLLTWKNLNVFVPKIQFKSNCKTLGKNIICIIVSTTTTFKWNHGELRFGRTLAFVLLTLDLFSFFQMIFHSFCWFKTYSKVRLGETEELKIPELWTYFFKRKAIDSCKYFYIDRFETASYGLPFFYLKEQLPQMEVR